MEFKVSHRGRDPSVRIERITSPGNRSGFVLPNGTRVLRGRPQLFAENFIVENLGAFCEGIERGLIKVESSGEGQAVEYTAEMLRQLSDTITLLATAPAHEFTEEVEEEEAEEVEEGEEVQIVDEAYFSKFSRSRLNRMAKTDHNISNPSQYSSKSALIAAILATLETVEGEEV